MVKGQNPLTELPFDLILRALVDLKRREVCNCTGSSSRNTFQDGHMSIRAIHLKATGVVLVIHSEGAEDAITKALEKV
jgi:hypothetical protein